MRRQPPSISPATAALAAIGVAAVAVLALASSSRVRKRTRTVASRLPRPGRPRSPAYSPMADRTVGTDRSVRPSGAEAMRDPPRNWTRADEQSDESFPASDPPATY